MIRGSISSLCRWKEMFNHNGSGGWWCSFFNHKRHRNHKMWTWWNSLSAALPLWLKKSSSSFRVLWRDSRFTFFLAPLERENFNHKRHRNHKIFWYLHFCAFCAFCGWNSSFFRVRSRDSRLKTLEEFWPQWEWSGHGRTDYFQSFVKFHDQHG